MIKILYALHHKKEERKLVISTWNNKSLNNEEIRYWNDCTYLANSRKVLREKALEIQKKWIEDNKKELIELEQIKIKTKYKGRS